MTTFDEAIAAIDHATNFEARKEARERVLGLSPSNEREAWRAEVRRLILCTPLDPDDAWQLPLDERCLALERLAVSPLAWPEDAERAYIAALTADVARRRRAAAFSGMEEIESRWGDSPRVVALRARLHLAFDERELAKEILESALTTHPGHHVYGAYAQLLYTVADFDNAERYARLLEGTPYAIEGADLRVGIAASRGDLEGELAAVTRAIDTAPDSDNLAARLAHRALIAASLNDLDAARLDLERALNVAPPDIAENFSEYVRHRLDAIDAAGAATKHRRLDAFPTVLQKWNYCGPAVIELCLRYLGIEMTQDLIAEAVKKDEGTPMLAIVEFLREQGLEARRVEATPDRLRAAIDLGVPVILEDDYSNTRHVTVAMGYDDRLGVLLVADPMTHAPHRQGIELRDALAGEHRFGGVAVLGHTSEVSDELRAALDKVGLVERKHIALLDEISRVHDDISPAFAETTALEAGGLARAALAMEPRFARAALIEANALLSGTTRSRTAVESTIAAARTRFPQMSEFASLASRWNQAQGKAAITIGESVLASVLDVARAQPRSDLAWSLASEGDRRLAYDYANGAIVRAPAHSAGTAALARILVDDLIDRSNADGGLGTVKSAFLGAFGHDTESSLELDLDTVAALAERITEAAVDMAPQDPGILLARGDFYLASAQLDKAKAAYEACADVAPGWFVPIVRLAHVLEAQGDDASCDVALHLMETGHYLRRGGPPRWNWWRDKAPRSACSRPLRVL